MKRQMVHTPPRDSALSPMEAGARADSPERWMKDEAAAENEGEHGMKHGRQAGAAVALKSVVELGTQRKARLAPPPPSSWGQPQGSQAQLTPGPKARLQFAPTRWDAPARYTKYAPGPWSRRFQPPR